MAIKTYLYRPLSLTAADLDPLLATGAGPVVGAPLPDTSVPITIDDSHKVDLDDAMASFGYVYIGEYTGGAALVGRHDFGALATDPTGFPITPSGGDLYYNTSLQMEMKYDSLRGKWLSVETSVLHFGRNGNVAAGQYYRNGGNGRVMSPAEGWYAERSGTVVALAYTRTGTAAATFDITAGGSSLATVASSATGGRDVGLNADFTFGQILAVRNQSGGNTTSNVIGRIKVKWRA